MDMSKRKIKNKMGYTLAEVLIAVAIIIVLCALGFMGYTHWKRAAEFRHNNDVASTVFSVLQSELSERRGNNRLDEIESLLRNGSDETYSGQLDLTAITTGEGTKSPTYAEIYSGYVDANGKSPIKPGPIYYVKGTAADWQKYLQNPASVDAQLASVYGMLYEYIFNGDNDLLNGCICVEFDPAEGLVYSVFFSEQAETLSYTDDPNLLDRQYDARRSHKSSSGGYDLVGYCGVENMSVSTSKVTTKPVIQNLMLNNENTLNLSFNLNTTIATKLMTYNISIFNSATNKKMADIEMNGITSAEGSSVVMGDAIYELRTPAEGISLVDCRVRRYDSAGSNVIDTAIITFPALVDEDGKITLILDAIDYNTASAGMQTAYGNYIQNANDNGIVDALANTFSIYRLGIQDADNIYCTVYAAGGGFSTTATKQSNQANRAFYKSETGKHNFDIANARHLYNLRFEETAALKSESDYTYTVFSDISLADAPVYSNYTETEYSAGSAVTTTGYQNRNSRDTLLLDEAEVREFPSFPEFGENSTLKSYQLGLANSIYAIQGFSFTKDSNIRWLEFARNSESDINGTGMFILNNGTINNIKLTDVTVKGIAADAENSDFTYSDRTGAFCGTNAGTLTKIQTVSTTVGASSVTGKDYVGGIFGYFEKEDGDNTQSKITELTNEATVTGERYVGGIVGLVSGTEIAAGSGSEYSVVVDGCKNFGSVSANDPARDGTVRAYVGGIVGLVDNVAIYDCISNPQYSGAVPTEADCYGYCVGGIVGLAYNTELTGCSTKLQTGYDRGYVVGDRYVGGIVGLCVGKSVISGSESSSAINDMYVVGNDYVGGIVGCNSNIKVLSSGSVTVGVTEFDMNALNNCYTLPGYINAAESGSNADSWYEQLEPTRLTPVSTPPNESELNVITVRYWNNQGTVLAYSHYAGGITGYNTGTVYDCVSSVYEAANNNGTCDYAGGIAGYNNGTLASTRTNKTLNVECYVTGNDYVGGIVGYNDVDAVVHNYKVSGGRVMASGSFVGGYAGLNASINLMQDETGKAIVVEADLNTIEGQYAVGGIIGGNIVPMHKNTAAVATFNVKNFLGSIWGTAAVGGYIGFNAQPMVTSAENYRDTLRTNIESANNTLRGLTSAADVSGDGKNAVLKTLENAVLGNETDGSVTLSIGESGSIITTTYSSGITGQLAVGGIIGYSSNSTYLNITNVVNKVPVTASKAVPYTQLDGIVSNLQGSALHNNTETYSLVGGIIGIINSRTKLVNCGNADIGDVNGQGTYTGGLAEVNLGSVESCTVASIGDTGKNNVGGLVGVNFSKVENTSASGAIVTGNNCVGGIAAENYGTISVADGVADLGVQATGDNVGGITGYNGVTGEGASASTGEITISGVLNVTVTSGGNNVGGVVGCNAYGAISASAESDSSVAGSVTGGSAVGGIIGLHESGNLSSMVNRASVTANTGNAAGIVGEVESSADTSITVCINSGAITSVTGNAAGIVGKNAATVSQCANYGDISGPAGSAGGICVTNEVTGSIIDCSAVASKADNWWDGLPEWVKNLFNLNSDVPVKVDGKINVGGIVAENSGTVSGSMLKNLSVSNFDNSENTSQVGGVAGVNNKDARIELTGSYSNVTVQTNVNGTATGGVAGTNWGAVNNGDNADNTVIGGKVEETTEHTGQETKYKVYDYIETPQITTGTTIDNKKGVYIDTGYKPNNSTKIVYDGYVVSGDTTLFGSRLNSGADQFTVQYIGSGLYRAAYKKIKVSMNSSVGEINNVTVRSVFTMNRSTINVNTQGTSITENIGGDGGTWSSAYPLYICAMNTANTGATNLGRVRMYSMEIYDGDTLVHRYLPARDTNDTPDDETDDRIGVLDVADPNAPVFIAYSTIGGSYTPTLGGTGTVYWTGDSTTTTLLDSLTIATGSAVTNANLGSVVGVNEAGAVIEKITVKNSAFADSTTILLGGDNYGYGGIAGINGGEIRNSRFSGGIEVSGSSAAIANVGGIAGKNLETGNITECQVGLDGKTIIQANVFGYIGGVSGWNCGSILSCNSYAGDEEDAVRYTVNIHSSYGHVGGIVGKQEAGAFINGTEEKPTATDLYWTVDCANYSNDCGTGGIIGYSESGNRGQNLEYINNYASVTNNGPSNAAVGGIIGRFQNNENGNMLLVNCANYGAIDGTLAGGLVGRVKYYGLTCQDCLNFGKISGSVTGGIVGDAYQNTSSVSFTNCVNNGEVKGSSVGGGIMGRITSGGGLNVSVFFGCANTGEIKGSGIAGDSTNSSSFIRCRNYGVASASGIASSSKVMTDCFDFRTKSSKLGSSSALTDSYFFSGELTGDAKTAMEEWISGDKNIGDNEASNNVKDATTDLQTADNGKTGLPLSYYLTENGALQLTSYKVWRGVASNPVAGIGIPKYDRAETARPIDLSYKSMEETLTAELSLIEQYYLDKYTDKIDETNSAVKNLKLEQKGNTLTAKWDAVTGAYAYKVCCEVTSTDEDGITTTTYYVMPIVYSNSWTINIPEEWVGSKIVVYVRAVDGSESAWEEQQSSEPIDGYCWTGETVTKDLYNWSSAEMSMIFPTLPTPDVYLELDGQLANGNSAGQGQFIAVLRNTAEFDAYLESIQAEATELVEITASGDAGTYNIYYTKGNVMSAHSINGQASGKTKENITLKASASSTHDGVVNTSLSASQQTWMMNGSTMGSQNMQSAKFTGFTGMLPSELLFGITAKGQNSALFVYQESELITERRVQLDGENYTTVPMAVSNNITRMISTEERQIVLENLPENLLEGYDPTDGGSFTVQNYPWSGQNDAIYYGHIVAAGLAESELAGLTDPQRSNENVFNGNTLNAGYVVYQTTAADGSVSYEVRYSAILAGGDRYKANINSSVYSYEMTERNGRNKVIVTATDNSKWLIQPYAEIAQGTFHDTEYQYTWADSTGTAGETVVDSGASYVLQLYGLDADGNRVLLKNTETISSASQDELGQKCYNAATGWQYTFVDTGNSWNYSSLTMRVIRIEPSGSADVWPYYNELNAKLHQRFTTMAAPTVTVPGDSGTMDYQISWGAIPEVEQNSGDFLCYEIAVEDVTNIQGRQAVEKKIYYLNSAGQIVTEKPTVSANPANTTAVIAMDDFNECIVSVSVRALAIDNSVTYRDGAAGVARILQLAARLETPDYTKLSMTPVYDKDRYTPRADIVKNGLTLTMEQDTRYADVSGLYELELYIYSNENGEQLLYTIDMSKLPSAFMTGRLNAGNSTFNVPNELTTTGGQTIYLSDLAGEYLYVSMRATSDNSISSYWTSGNHLNEKTRIPRMQLTEPTLMDEGAELREYTVYGKLSADDTDPQRLLKEDGTERKIQVKQQKVFSWENDVTDGGYILHLTRAIDEVNNVPQRSALEIALERNGNGNLTLGGVELSENTFHELPYTVRIEQVGSVGSWYSVYTDLKAYLYLDSNTDTIKLYLPDNTEKDTDFSPFDTTGAWTRNITVQAISSDNEKDYVSSMGSYLYRTGSEITSGWEAATVDMSTLPVAVNGAGNPPSAQQLPVELSYDEATQRLIATFDGAGSNYRLMLRLHYTSGGEEYTAEYSMTADDATGKNSFFDLTSMAEAWDTITGAEIRLIATSNHELFGKWSAEQFTLDNPVYRITYNLAGGVLAASNRTSYTADSEDFTLTNPTRENYVFAGWDDGSATELTVTISHGSTGKRAYTATWTEE